MALKTGQVQEPPLSRLLFADTRLAPLWLVMRLYCAYVWFAAGWQKLQDPLWFGPQAGAVLREFGQRTLAAGDGGGIGLMESFVQRLVLPYSASWSYGLVLGEIVIGLCLAAGLLTGLAACASLILSAAYLFAGVIGFSPISLVLALCLTLAWRVAGFWGLDRYVLGYLAWKTPAE